MPYKDRHKDYMTIVSFSKRFLKARLDRVRFGTNKSRLREIRNSAYSPIVISEIT